jgi:hypothetical protein
MSSKLQRGSARGGSRGRGNRSRGRDGRPQQYHRDHSTNYRDRTNGYGSHPDRSNGYASRPDGYRSERGRSTHRNELAAVRHPPGTYADRTCYGRQQPAVVSQEPDLQHVLKEISNALISLVGRVDSLEKIKGSDSKTASVNRPIKTAVPAGPILHKSHNNDFVSVSKAIYKIIQIGHHASNWERLPRSIEERLTRLVGDINPPMADSDFRSDINVLAQTFGEELRRLVSDHLNKKALDTEMVAGSLDPTDVNRAKDVASKYLTSRLGRRLAEPRRTELMNSAASMIGAHRRPPPITSTLSMTDAVWTTVKSRTPPRTTSPNPPESSRKRKNASTGSTPVENRFNALTHEHVQMMDGDVEPDEQPEQSTSPKIQRSPKKPRPAHRDETTTSHGVHVFTGKKDEWRVTADSPDICVIVVGDSNLRKATLIPDYWQINCLPGADLCHLADGLADLAGDSKQFTVVLQAGMNHRANHDSDDEQDIKSILFAARRNPAISEIFFNGVSIPSTLPAAEADRLNRLNIFMEAELGSAYFIPPLKQSDVHVDANDRWQIHYTQETVNLISQAMIHRITGKVF